jgi:bacteriorhodopsin
MLQLIELDNLVLRNGNIKYLRYVEWTICTPMMTYEICVTTSMQHYHIVSIVVLTVAFCFCGSVAAVTPHVWAKILLGSQGTLYCIVVLFVLWKSVLDKDNDGQSLKKKIGYGNLIVTSFFWPLYVVSWGLGPDVFHLISTHHESLIQAIMSILLKTFALSYSFLTFDMTFDNLVEYGIDVLSNLS